MQVIVSLSWFHRKVGPLVFYHYPEGELKEDQKIRIADQIDQAFEEGFFSHSFDNFISMNYYFEIYSKWARGQKEMLMLSAIFESSVSSDVEHLVLANCIDFAKKLKENQEMYKAFYSNEDPQYIEESVNIKKNYDTIIEWVKELYWIIIEVTRERTEEEKLASIMNDKTVQEIVKFLSQGPISKEDLKFWFSFKNPNIDIDKYLKKLENERIVFVNDIGVENYVLLLKKISVTRIPPEYLILYFEEKPELEALTTKFYEKVREYFNHYEANDDDASLLFELVSNPKIYNVLIQLRTGPIEKSKITTIMTKDHLEEINKVLKKLEISEIIEEYQVGEDTVVVLKTDIRFTTGFPEYLKALIPKQTKELIAKAYEPVHKQMILNQKIESDNENQVLENIFEEEGENLLGTKIQDKDIFNDLKSLSESLIDPEDDDIEKKTKDNQKKSIDLKKRHKKG